jgi:endonuclease/exonuclease/phosphatase family metal-dependent hydrolase
MTEEPTFRVLSWNLWWQFGPWEERQPAIATLLERQRADVVCLQEVWATDTGIDQSAILANRLGLHHARTASPFWNGKSFGNAVLSRWPILDTTTIPLPGPDGGASVRQALCAHIDAPFGVFTAICAHLDFRFDRSQVRSNQLAAICAYVSSAHTDPEGSFPVVLAADLNAVPDSDEVRALTGRCQPHAPGVVFTDAWEVAGDGSPGFTWDARNPYLLDSTWPNRRIDYILTSWPRPKGVGKAVRCFLTGTEPVHGVMPSDHFAVVADIRVR